MREIVTMMVGMTLFFIGILLCCKIVGMFACFLFPHLLECRL